MRIITRFWSAHTHSRYSNNDALPDVEAIVARAAELGQPAVGLTDHGNMAGSVELYQACAKYGLKAFPGSELYFVPDIDQHRRDYANKAVKAQRYHLGVLAYTTEGYQNLVHLSTTSHKQHFHKPLVDLVTLAQLAEDGKTQGLAVTTGCFFGYLAQKVIVGEVEVAEKFLHTLNAWFPDSVYVEIQNHQIDHGDGWNDSMLADELVVLADRVGLPVVLTQDAHYLREEDRGDHESLKRLVAWGDTPDDAVFPGDGFQLADSKWIRDRHPDARLERGLQGLDHLLSRHRLSIPVLDSYSYSVPQVVADPHKAMLDSCARKMAENGMLHLPKYREQFAEEATTIEAAGMAGYMMLVKMVTDYMKENDIVFQTRGSAAGSLVCYLLGITQVDPLQWDLRFERFLSRDRTKPPDIDLDIAHDRREEVINWLNTKFVAHQIGSWATYSMDKDEEQKGSLLRRYFSSQRTKGLKFDEIPQDALNMLHRLSSLDLFSGMGTNAAGIVLTSNEKEFNALVPMHHRTSGGLVTQYSKDDIEALGLVKLDVLGSKTLTVLRKTVADTGVDLESIPLRDKKTLAMLRRGDTAGVFQLEGGSSKWGIKRLGPTSVRDVIAAMALFRPATMKSGGTDAYLNRRHGKERVPQRHSLLEKATKDTYGILLFQEQVIDLLRGLGMEAEDLTKFLKAVKASNKNIGGAGKVIHGYQGWIQKQCDRLGMTGEDRKFLDEAINGFAEYGFNRAHATVYGLTAYRCAYLAVHHGLHFHCALLDVASGSDKEAAYLSASRARGYRVSRPEINKSAASYRVDEHSGTIRRGLTSIKGVGERAAMAICERQPYSSIKDLVDRTPRRPVTGGKTFATEGVAGFSGVLRILLEAGCLDQLPEK